MPEARGDDWDVAAIRSHFDFPDLGRTVTNNAASTQPPRELVDQLARLTAATRTCTAVSRALRRR